MPDGNQTEETKYQRMEPCFQYGETEIAYLKSRDKRLSEIIDSVGLVQRRAIPDLFAALVHSIVGQQISTKAHETLWNRLIAAFGEASPERMAGLSIETLQSIGISFRKADYIKQAAVKVLSGQFDIAALSSLNDAEVCRRLSSLNGIGRWSAEMLMLFSMQRPDILSYDDLAIRRGLRMVYRHREIDRKLFEKYRRRYSPCGSVASLYLWAVAGGAIEGLTDPAGEKQNRKPGVRGTGRNRQGQEPGQKGKTTGTIIKPHAGKGSTQPGPDRI